MQEVTPQDADNVIRMSWPSRHTHAGCTGACHQGRLPCQAPHACFMPEEPPTWSPSPGERALMVAVYLASGALMAAIIFAVLP